MSRFLQQLSDASKSGVYRTARADVVLAATRGSALRVVRVDLAGATGKDELIGRVAAALEFPEWFGGNWDALEDCLSDLSWSAAGGWVLLFEGVDGLPADERGILLDILASAASFWKERGRPFFAVFIGDEPRLPEF